MKSVPLTAYSRTAVRRGGVKKLRSSGRVPAVIYGRQVQPQNLELKQVEIDNLIHHSATENVLLDLSLDQHGIASVYTAAPGSTAFQQQLYLTAGNSEVPEPGTLAMLAIGGLGIYFGTWRRRRS